MCGPRGNADNFKSKFSPDFYANLDKNLLSIIDQKIHGFRTSGIKRVRSSSEGSNFPLPQIEIKNSFSALNDEVMDQSDMEEDGAPHPPLILPNPLPTYLDAV